MEDKDVSKKTLKSKMGSISLMVCAALLILNMSAAQSYCADGWASMNGGTTGGQGGETVTVSNAEDFIYYVQDTGQTPYIIQVSGNINLGGSNIRVRGNKTVIGLPGSHISGNLKCYTAGESNNIFQNLSIDNEAGVGDGDCLTIDGVQHIWIDHCTFMNGGDGNVDIKNGADYVTVSWCVFYYTFDSGHNFCNLVGHSDDNGGTDSGHLKVTFHHNWWASMCKERMPRVRFGQVHVYNNYYSNLLAGGYCIGVGNNSQIRAENNYFESVPMPWKNYSDSSNQGIIGWSGNVYANCEEPTWAPNSSVFSPPYSYSLDNASSIPSIVSAGAGSGGGGGTTTTTTTAATTTTASTTTTTAATTTTTASGSCDCGVCNWYGTNIPICCQSCSGWGFEDGGCNRSCVCSSSCPGSSTTTTAATTTTTASTTTTTAATTTTTAATTTTTTATTSTTTTATTTTTTAATTTTTAGTTTTTTAATTTTTATGQTCSPVDAAISAPFTKDGAGTFCWTATACSYINSWNVTTLTVNGVNFTNTYASSSQLPAKIDGNWYIYYNGSVGWSHFELK